MISQKRPVRPSSLGSGGGSPEGRRRRGPRVPGRRRRRSSATARGSCAASMRSGRLYSCRSSRRWLRGGRGACEEVPVHQAPGGVAVAGGGRIKRVTGSMNARLTRVVARPKPTEREPTQCYFRHYIGQVPAAGEIVL